MNDFSHLNQNRNPRMVDITKKEETKRRAVAETKVWLPEKIREKFKDGDICLEKGAVFQTAIVAGTMGLKQTSNLIPLCHQINIEGSEIEINFEGEFAVILCEVSTFGKTGVEMEALVGAQIAALTIYDMCKSLGHEMRIENCRLIEKRGGKSDYRNKS